MSELKTLDIVIIGVGGQGTLLASRVLGHMAGLLSFDVKVSEVHGMSQRGGSVSTYVRMGKKVYSPLVEQEGADYVLAFEELEAIRALPSLKKDGTLIVNTQQIMPLPVIVGAAEYPQEVIKTLEANAAKVIAVNALPMAKKAGNERTVNTVLMGVLAKQLPYEKALWEKALAACIPERLMPPNLAAFEAGYNETSA